MRNSLLNNYQFNLRYAEALVADVDDEMMTYSPGSGLENHPAFTLGHLVSAAALTAKYLGGPYTMELGWEELFKRNGPGDPRLPERDKTRYPQKTILLSELTKQHQLVTSHLIHLSNEKLNTPAQWRYSKHMPTLGDLLYFMCITHEAMHLGQLAGWRRALGLPSALAQL